MKIFLSYGYDPNVPLIEKIKEYLSKVPEGNLKREVWIDTSEIKAAKLLIYPMSINPRWNCQVNLKEALVKCPQCDTEIDSRWIETTRTKLFAWCMRLC